MGTLGNSVDKYVTGRMLQTSNDRRWSHLLAEIWSHEAGELPSQLPRDTEIAIQLRGHSLVDRRGAGMHQRTLGRKGTVWLCPAGISEDFINIENPMQECLHVFLPGKPFDETMLKDLDIDPSGIRSGTRPSIAIRSSSTLRIRSSRRWRQNCPPAGF